MKPNEYQTKMQEIKTRLQWESEHQPFKIWTVNRERSCLTATSSMCDSTKHNGLVTLAQRLCTGKDYLNTESFQKQAFGN